MRSGPQCGALCILGPSNVKMSIGQYLLTMYTGKYFSNGTDFRWAWLGKEHLLHPRVHPVIVGKERRFKGYVPCTAREPCGGKPLSCGGSIGAQSFLPALCRVSFLFFASKRLDGPSTGQSCVVSYVRPRYT